MKIIFLLFLLINTSLYSKDYSLEVGVGIASLYYPNYLGSKSIQTITLPIPYLRYKSKYLNIDKNGLNSKLFGINNLRLELSVSGSLPANSNDSKVREDMPDIDSTGEVGFQIIYNIYQHGVALLQFELPIRTVFSTDFNTIKYRGITSTPQLKYSLNYKKVQFTLRSGFILSNKEYNNYFYEVKEKYITPQRIEYKASSGFGGFKNRMGISYKKDKWWGGAFISHYNIKSAIFKDSPLVESNTGIYMGISVAYIFYTNN